MPTATCSTLPALRSAIVQDGFAFVHGVAMRELLALYGMLTDWATFADSWNDLELDTYMADGGRYRRRRHAVYHVARDEAAARLPHQPHVQALAYNPMHGGIERWFAPIEPEIGSGPSMGTILAFCRSLFGALEQAEQRGGRDSRRSADVGRSHLSGASWRAEVHQFRIEAGPNELGRPTPEGLHQDGVDYVLVLLVNRRNIARGITSIHGLDGRPLGTFTLTEPFDAAVVDDARVAHGVTPVEPIDPELPAHRDVLVVTFARDVTPSRQLSATLPA